MEIPDERELPASSKIDIAPYYSRFNGSKYEKGQTLLDLMISERLYFPRYFYAKYSTFLLVGITYRIKNLRDLEKHHMQKPKGNMKEVNND